MSEPNNELHQLWQQAKQTHRAALPDATSLINRAKAHQRHTRNFHFGNMAVLSATVAGLLVFFRYVAPLQTTLSHLGIGLMIGGLLLRILIEGYSVVRSARINLSANAQQATSDALTFLRFRKVVHGWVTIAIVLLYSLGFYLLTPEFSQYFSLPWMILIDGSYLVGAAVLIILIRRGIKREMTALAELVAIKQDMNAA
ncbi:MAG: hypothetical protein WA958_18095 [Tunicatimonas sp.]